MPLRGSCPNSTASGQGRSLGLGVGLPAYCRVGLRSLGQAEGLCEHLALGESVDGQRRALSGAHGLLCWAEP